jgi:hypothetical protein
MSLKAKNTHWPKERDKENRKERKTWKNRNQ